MFAVPFGRMLWKEYRVNRALWLSCLFIGFLFQVIQWQMIIEPQLRSSVLIAGSSFFSVLYAIGCGALLFASEREERTCDWLTAMSIPPAATLSAKYLFAIASTIAMQLALALISLVFLVGASPPNLWMAALPFGLPVIVWASLGSLLSRRVLTSVPTMAFWCLLSHALLLYVLAMRNTNNAVIEYSCVALLTVFAFSMDLWLGWRWCRGHYYDGALLENLNHLLGRWWSEFTLHEAARTRVPCRTEYDQPWRRTWQRLIWQERRRESLHLYLMAIECVTGVGFVLSVGLGQGSPTFGLMMFAVMALICVTPLTMGIFGFRADRQFQQPRFLSNRGISPPSLWLAKHVVWLPRAFWIPSVAIVVTIFFAMLTDPSGSVPPQARQLVESISEVAWFILLSYASGQLAAVLFQRAVLAIAFGALLNIVMFLWLGTVINLALPQWWSLGLLIIAMLLITLWQMRPWLLEDHSWSRRWRLTLVLVATPALLLAIFAFHRVYEIPSPFSLDDQNQRDLMAALNQRVRPLSKDEEFVRLRLDVLFREADPDNQRLADEIVELMRRDVNSVCSPTEALETQIPNKLCNILTEAANEYAGADRLDKAFDCHLAALKLARTTSSPGLPYYWQRGTIFQKATLEELMSWANHRLQTPASIREAIKVIEAELRKFPSATEGVIESYSSDRKRWILSSRTELIEELSRYNTVQSTSNYQSSAVAFSLLPWERMRLDRLMSFNAQMNLNAILSLENHLLSPDGLAHRSVSRQFSDFTALAALGASLDRTTFLAPEMGVPINLEMVAVVDRQTMVRAGLTRLELIAYRLEHGKLPDRLVQLMPTIGGLNLVDPWSGRMFEYYPAFLLSAGRSEIDLLPLTPEKVEFKLDGYQYAGRGVQSQIPILTLTLHQLMRESTKDVRSRIEELKQDPLIAHYLFAIPPGPLADRQP